MLKNFYLMTGFYATTSSIKELRKNQNSIIDKILESVSFDSSPQEFEEKCNEALKEILGADSDFNMAKLFGIYDKDKIHDSVAENFKIDDTNYENLSALHLLIVNREARTITSTLSFPDPLNPIYSDDVLTGMPTSYSTEGNRQEIIPFAKFLDKLFAGNAKYRFIADVGLNPFDTVPTIAEVKIIKEKAPRFFPAEPEELKKISEKIRKGFERLKKHAEKDYAFFSIPSAEKLRIASLIANSFGIELRDNSLLIEQFSEKCPPFRDQQNFNQSFSLKTCTLLKKSLNKIYWSNNWKTDTDGITTTEKEIIFSESINERFIPSEFNIDSTVAHEFGHAILYPANHPNFNSLHNNVAYSSQKTDYFFGSLSSKIIPAEKENFILCGMLRSDYSCNSSIMIGPIDFVAKRFAEYCSFRFQNKTLDGINYKQAFEELNLPKIDTGFCLPRASDATHNKIMLDSAYNFIHVALIISAVDIALALSKKNRNQEQRDSRRELLINRLAMITAVFVYGFDSALIFGAKVFAQKLLQTQLAQGITTSVCEKTGYDNSSLKQSVEDTKKSFDKLPSITKNALKTFATFNGFFILKNFVGGNPLIVNSSIENRDVGTLYYDQNTNIGIMLCSCLLSSLALGLHSAISEKLIFKSPSRPSISPSQPEIYLSPSSLQLPSTSPSPISRPAQNLANRIREAYIVESPRERNLFIGRA